MRSSSNGASSSNTFNTSMTYCGSKLMSIAEPWYSNGISTFERPVAGPWASSVNFSGAKWNITAAYGAAMRGEVPGVPANNPAAAEKLLEGIFKNVTVLDKSANDSFKNFTSGNGDVALVYENQLLADKAAGGDDTEVVPPSTVLIQTPTVVVDKNAASINFIRTCLTHRMTPAAQRQGGAMAEAEQLIPCCRSSTRPAPACRESP